MDVADGNLVLGIQNKLADEHVDHFPTVVRVSRDQILDESEIFLDQGCGSLRPGNAQQGVDKRLDLRCEQGDGLVDLLQYRQQIEVLSEAGGKR